MHINELGNRMVQWDDGQDAPAATKSESETQGALENEPHPADLKAIAGDIYNPNGLHHDASLPSKDPTSSKESIRESGSKKTPAPSGEVVENKNSGELDETHGQDSTRAARNEVFQERWKQIKKQGESPEIDTNNMHELHHFEQMADNASFETMQNIASLMSFMQSMKTNPAVQKTGTLVDKMSGGKIPKKSAEKYMRTIPHIFHAMAMSTDPDTRKMTAGAFRLAFTPNLVDGDVEAGKKGLETKEVRLIRDSIKRHLKKSGFNPSTGELVDKDRLKSMADAREAAAEKQKEFFLNGFETLSAPKE